MWREVLPWKPLTGWALVSAGMKSQTGWSWEAICPECWHRGRHISSGCQLVSQDTWTHNATRPSTLWKGPIFKGFKAFISFPLVKHYFLTSGFLTKADVLYPKSLFIVNILLVHILVAWDAFDLILKLSREIRGRDQLEADCLSW